MISTTEVLDILQKKYNLKIDGSLLYKYHNMGLLQKEQKIGKRREGVKRYWKDITPDTFYLIRLLNKQPFFRLDRVEKYFNLLNFNNPEENIKIIELSKREKVKDNISNKMKPGDAAEYKAFVAWYNGETFMARIDLVNLNLIAVLRALVELGLFEPKFITNLKMGFLKVMDKAKVDINKNYILVDFRKVLNKRIWFTKDGIKTE